MTSLNLHSPRFNLAQNAESGQANAVEKVVLIDTGGQKPMGV